MIRVVLTDAVYDAIASTLPKGAARWPMQRDRGQCFIQVEAAVVDRIRAMRRPRESYRDVILRLASRSSSSAEVGMRLPPKMTPAQIARRSGWRASGSASVRPGRAALSARWTNVRLQGKGLLLGLRSPLRSI